MNFRKMIAILLGFSMIIISGCTVQKVEEEKPVDKIQGKITIWADKQNLEALKLSIDNFKKIHDKAIIQVLDMNNAEIYNKFDNSLSLHSDIPDVIIVEDENVQSFLKSYSTALEDTSDDIKKDDYIKYKTDNLTKDGKLLGIPLDSKPGVLLYRKDMFKAAGVNAEYIKTWQDFISAGNNVISKDKVPMLSLPLGDEKTYRMFLNQLGGSYFDKTGIPVVNSDIGIKAAEMLKSLYSGKVIQNTNSLDSAITLLTQGKVASALVSLEDINKLIKNHTELKDKLGIMSLPAFEEGGNEAITMGGNNLLILNSSTNKNLAIEFSKYEAENRENIKMLLEKEGMFPAYNSIDDENWFLKKDSTFKDIKLWKLFSDEANDIYSINYTEKFTSLIPSIKAAQQSIILKGADSKLTLDDLQKKLKIAK